MDNIIERSPAFISIIENYQDIIEIPECIKLISVDYTFSSDEEIILEKFSKYYQAEDRFLIIVLLGEKSPTKVDKLKEKLNNLRIQDDGSNHFNHITILTVDEYIKFLTPRIICESSLIYKSKAWEFLRQYYSIKHWSFNIFDHKDIYNNILKYWDLSLHYLSEINTDWINDYLPQN